MMWEWVLEGSGLQNVPTSWIGLAEKVAGYCVGLLDDDLCLFFLIVYKVIPHEKEGRAFRCPADCVTFTSSSSSLFSFRPFCI